MLKEKSFRCLGFWGTWGSYRVHQNENKFIRTCIFVSFLSSLRIIQPSEYLERESCSEKIQFPLNSVLSENLSLSLSKGYENETSFFFLIWFFGYSCCLYSTWQLYPSVKEIFSKYTETEREIELRNIYGYSYRVSVRDGHLPKYKIQEVQLSLGVCRELSPGLPVNTKTQGCLYIKQLSICILPMHILLYTLSQL